MVEAEKAIEDSRKREGFLRSGGVFDKDLKRFVPTPKTDKGSRFYVTPAGITNTKQGR